MHNWPFSELGWWINAIYHYAGFTPPAGTDTIIDSTVSPYRKLEAINDCYQQELEKISSLDMDENQARSLLFAGKALRKWQFCESNSMALERSRRARQGFRERNQVARDTSYFGCSATLRWLMRSELSRYLPEVSLDRVHGKFGPGAVAEHLTHPRRFSLLGEWARLPHWPEIPIGHRAMDHSTARLSAVPKQYDKDRLITVEPCYNSFVQQYVRSCILESVHHGPLRGTCMDLEYTDGQAIQRRLAQKASLDRSLATLDLSDASDRITWDIVQDVFPSWVVDLLQVSRSEFYCEEDSSSPSGTHTDRVYMFAGMGNASTFIVETLFFTAYVKALGLMHGIERPRVSVFGDDVICSTDMAMILLNNQSIYFRINISKSFIRLTDRLRESCGIFAYNGKDITVPRIDGFTPDYEGKLGLCELVERLTALGEKYDLRYSALAYLIVETGRHYGIANFPRKLEGYPSFHSWYNEFDAVPLGRRNHSTQDVEYKVQVREPGRQFVSLTRQDSLTLGLYAGWYCGQVRTVQHRNRLGVYFPNGRFVSKRRWVRTERGF